MGSENDYDSLGHGTVFCMDKRSIKTTSPAGTQSRQYPVENQPTRAHSARRYEPNLRCLHTRDLR